MKLDKEKKIFAALFTASIFMCSNSAIAVDKYSYIDNGNLIIREVDSYTVTIDEKQLDNCENILLKIGDEVVSIDSIEIQKLKEQAKREEKELNQYKYMVYTSLGVITIIVIMINHKKNVLLK